jgi:hypothetical protein
MFGMEIWICVSRVEARSILLREENEEDKMLKSEGWMVVWRGEREWRRVKRRSWIVLLEE